MKKPLFAFLPMLLIVSMSAGQIRQAPYTQANPHSYPYFFPMINGTVSEVKLEMNQVGGSLKTDRFIKATAKSPSYRELIYSVSDSTKREYPVHTGLDIYKAIFYFKRFKSGKEQLCYEYSTWYSSEAFLPDLIKQFDNSTVGFNRVGKSLKWIKKDIMSSLNRQIDLIKIDNAGKNGFIFKIQRI